MPCHRSPVNLVQLRLKYNNLVILIQCPRLLIEREELKAKSSFLTLYTEALFVPISCLLRVVFSYGRGKVVASHVKWSQDKKQGSRTFVLLDAECLCVTDPQVFTEYILCASSFPFPCHGGN